MTHTLLPLLPLLFPVFFVGLWLGVCALLASVSGWSALAARFGATTAAPGETFAAVSGSVGAVGYRNCLSLTISPAGFSLGVMVLFRFHHPALYFPREQIESVRQEKRWLVMQTVVRLHDMRTQIVVLGKAGQRLMEIFG